MILIDRDLRNNRGATSESNYFYALPPAFAVGVQDSINPYSLSALLIFYIVLLFWRRLDGKIFLRACIFIMAFMLNNLRVVLGGYDSFLSYSISEKIIFGVHFLFSIFFIIIGIDYFQDWSARKRGVSERVGLLEKITAPLVKVPQQSMQPVGRFRRAINSIFSFLSVWILGFLISFLVSVWPPDYLLFLNIYYGLQSGSVLGPIIAFGMYALGFSIFFILLAFGFVARGRWQTQGKSKGSSFQSIILAAIFISIGIGLIQLLSQSLFQ